MLAEERFAAIIDKVTLEKAVTVAELAQSLDTSESTIRRDLNYLDRSGRLTKVRGGAVVRETEFSRVENDMKSKEGLRVSEKEMIGAYAATLVHDDDVVYIDAGTTTLHMVQHLSNSKAIFVTNSIVHADLLGQAGLEVYLTGGRLKTITSALVGSEAEGFLREYNFTKAFMGTNGIAIAQGLTTPDPEEASIKRTAVNHSYIVYALADHSKFSKVYATRFALLEKVCVITDFLDNKAFEKATIIKEVAKS